MKKIRIVKSIPILFSFVAFIISIVAYGAGGIAPGGNYENRRLVAFIFGGGSMYDANKVNGSYKLDAFSGISLFGVLAFSCLIVGIMLFIFDIFKQKDKMYIVSCCFIIFSGILILFILVTGTNVGASPYYYLEYEKMLNSFQLGVGTIIWSLLCVLGGGFGILYSLLRLCKS